MQTSLITLDLGVKPPWTVGVIPPYACGVDETEIQLRKAIGARLKEARKKAGLTQAEVADWFGLGHKAISAWEAGNGMPNAIQLRRIALEYDNATVDDLLCVKVEMLQQVHITDALGETVGARKRRGRVTKEA